MAAIELPLSTSDSPDSAGNTPPHQLFSLTESSFSPESDTAFSRAANALCLAPQIWDPQLDKHTFVYFQPKQGRVLLARGRHSTFKAFYTKSKTSLRIFDNFKEVPNRAARLDFAWVAARGHGFLVADDSTPYSGVKSLQPGEIVEFGSGGKFKTHHYPVLPKLKIYRSFEKTSNITAHELLDEAEELITCAVGESLSTLDSAKPVALTLSGGLDSGIIAGAVARHTGSNQRIYAYTVCGTEANLTSMGGANHQRNEDWSEFSQAEKVASRFDQIFHSRISSTTKSLPAILWHFIEALSDVIPAPAAVWWHHEIQSKAHALGCRAMFSGQFGNETISPAGLRQFASIAPTNNTRLWMRLAKEASQAQSTSFFSSILNYGIKPWLRRIVDNSRNQARSLLQERSSFNPFRKSFLAGDDIVGRLEESTYQHPDLQAYKSKLFTNAFERLCYRNAVNDELGYTPVVYPFTDFAFREFCWRLPVDVMLREGETRWFARRLYERFVGFSAPEIIPSGSQSGDWHSMFVRDRHLFLEIFQSINKISSVSKMLDIEALVSATARIPSDQHSIAKSDYFEFCKVARGLGFGIFFALHAPSHDQVDLGHLKSQLGIS